MNLSLGGYPFVDYELRTPQEAAHQAPVQPIQLPLWSEILMAPEPDIPASLDEDTTRRPFVVTFYSFKGGVGRSTALAFVANILATRGLKVVMIDFDLEAPGLSSLYLSEDTDTYGVLDYIHQRFLTPDENQPSISECIRRIDVPARGELYLIPAGEYDEGYIHRLADLDIHVLYQRERNPIHQLLDEVKAYLDPDIILIDARTGFTEMGAIALFDQADLGIICFSPTNQSFTGLRWVVKAASKQRSYRGIPDLRFLLTPVPPVAQSQQMIWTLGTAEWITNNWGVPPALTVEELYYQVPYNPTITTLESLFGEIPPGILEPYMPVADAIAASLPETKSDMIKLAESRPAILDELQFRAATAQEMNPADIPEIFQRTGDFSKFLQDRSWLVRGAKGTGKTLLFRLFVERSADARSFAQTYTNLTNVEFIPGHGQDYHRRRRALEALLGWWVENGSALNSIVPKILLREDIWNSLNFTNKAYFSARYVQLRWEEGDLWRLVLRQALGKSPTLATLVHQQSGVDKEQLDNSEEGQLRRSLYILWGERMGRGNKAYTYNWVRNRISDSKNNRFPRSLIQLLQQAITIEKRTSERNPYDAIIRPRALIDALPFVSEQRVAEVRNEYPEFANLLDKLSGERSPIDQERLGRIWNINGNELIPLIGGMIEAGILQEYLRSLDSDMPRYSVAELYLYGLGMTRQGQR